MSIITRIRLLLVSLSIALLIGCSKSPGPALVAVSGTITMDNLPLADVRVIFVPEGKGSPSFGSTDKNGQFKLMYSHNRAGAELGTHQVILETREPHTDDSGNLIGDPTPVEIPEKYRRPGALSATVTAGRNKFDFSIEAKAARG